MKELSLLFFLTLCLHTGTLIVFNRYRVRRTIARIKALRHLPAYSNLLADYEGFFGYLHPFPSRENFQELYLDKEFSDFATSGAKIFKYLFISTPVLVAITVILVSMHTHSGVGASY
jgi:hypothetical protein